MKKNLKTEKVIYQVEFLDWMGLLDRTEVYETQTAAITAGCEWVEKTRREAFHNKALVKKFRLVEEYPTSWNFITNQNLSTYKRFAK